MQTDIGPEQSNATFQPHLAPGLAFPMPMISPVINGQGGTVNFTVNVCPSGSVSIGASSSSSNEGTYEKVLEGTELEDLQ